MNCVTINLRSDLRNVFLQKIWRREIDFRFGLFFLSSNWTSLISFDSFTLVLLFGGAKILWLNILEWRRFIVPEREKRLSLSHEFLFASVVNAIFNKIVHFWLFFFAVFCSIYFRNPFQSVYKFTFVFISIIHFKSWTNELISLLNEGVENFLLIWI